MKGLTCSFDLYERADLSATTRSRARAKGSARPGARPCAHHSRHSRSGSGDRDRARSKQPERQQQVLCQHSNGMAGRAPAGCSRLAAASGNPGNSGSDEMQGTGSGRHHGRSSAGRWYSTSLAFRLADQRWQPWAADVSWPGIGLLLLRHDQCRKPRLAASLVRDTDVRSTLIAINACFGSSDVKKLGAGNNPAPTVLPT